MSSKLFHTYLFCLFLMGKIIGAFPTSVSNIGKDSCCGRAPAGSKNFSIHSRFEPENAMCNFNNTMLVWKTTLVEFTPTLRVVHSFTTSDTAGNFVKLSLQLRQKHQKSNNSVCASFSVLPRRRVDDICRHSSTSSGSERFKASKHALISDVVNAKVSASASVHFTENISIIFRHRTEYPVQHCQSCRSSIETRHLVCVFWDRLTLSWSTRGCRVLSTNVTHTSCECDHLSSFAVMVNLVGNTRLADNDLLSVLGLIGSVLSCLSLLCVYFTFSSFENLKCVRHSIHQHLSVCLFCGYLSHLVASALYPPAALCMLTSLLQHYWWLCSFAWMGLEGTELLLMFMPKHCNEIRKKWSNTWTRSYVWGYLMPFIVVMAAVLDSGSGSHSYYDSSYCFLNHELVWYFVGPMLVVVCFNSGVLTFSIYLMLAHSVSSKQSKERSIMRKLGMWFKGTAMLVSVLGIPWLIGLLDTSQSGNVTIVSLLHVVANSMQGVFVFILQCILNDKVWVEYMRLLSRLQWLPDRCKPDPTKLSIMTESAGGRRASYWKKSKGKSFSISFAEFGPSMMRSDALERFLSGWAPEDEDEDDDEDSEEEIYETEDQMYVDDDADHGGGFWSKAAEFAKPKGLFFIFSSENVNEATPDSPDFTPKVKTEKDRKKKRKQQAKWQRASVVMSALTRPRGSMASDRFDPEERSRRKRLERLLRAKESLPNIPQPDESSLLFPEDHVYGSKLTSLDTITNPPENNAVNLTSSLLFNRGPSLTELTDKSQERLFNLDLFCKESDPDLAGIDTEHKFRVEDQFLVESDKLDDTKANKQIYKVVVTKKVETPNGKSPTRKSLARRSLPQTAPRTEHMDLLFGRTPSLEHGVDLSEGSDSFDELPTIIVEQLAEESMSLSDEYTYNMLGHFKYRFIMSNVSEVPTSLVEVKKKLRRSSQPKPIIKGEMSLFDIMTGQRNPEIIVNRKGLSQKTSSFYKLREDVTSSEMRIKRSPLNDSEETGKVTKTSTFFKQVSIRSGSMDVVPRGVKTAIFGPLSKVVTFRRKFFATAANDTSSDKQNTATSSGKPRSTFFASRLRKISKMGSQRKATIADS